MKPQTDYLWIVLAAIALVLVVSWPKLSGWFGAVSDNIGNKDQLDRGREVFYSDEVFAGKGSNRSCATCHAADFIPPDGVEITMQDYVEGKPFILKNIKANYGSNLLSSRDPLFEQLTSCLTRPSRMGCGKVSRNVQTVQDLVEYIRVQ